MRLPEAQLVKPGMEKEPKRFEHLDVYKLVLKPDVREGQNVIGPK